MKRQAISLMVMITPLLLLAFVEKEESEEEAHSSAKAVLGHFGGTVTDYYGPDVDEKDISSEDPDLDKKDQCVTFRNSSLTDADLVRIRAALQVIKPAKLDLRFTNVTGACLCELLSLGKLQELDLSSTLVDGRGLEQLAALPALKYVKLSYNRLVVEEMIRFFAAESAAGNKIHLYLSHISMISKEALGAGTLCQNQDLLADVWLAKLVEPFESSQLNFLTGLDISYVGLTDAKLEYLERFHELEELNLAGNKDIIKKPDDKKEKSNRKNQPDLDVTLWFLSKEQFHNLKHLDLSGLDITDNVLQKYIKDYNKLEVLALAGTKITDKGLDPSIINHNQNQKNGLEPSIIKRNQNLKKLDISKTKTVVRPEVLQGIGALVKLRSLNLSETGIDDDGLVEIWQKNREKIGEKFLGSLRGSLWMFSLDDIFLIGELRSLDISKTSVTDKWLTKPPLPVAIDSIQDVNVVFPSLTALNYTDTKMTAGAIRRRNAILLNYRSSGLNSKGQYAEVPNITIQQ